MSKLKWIIPLGIAITGTIIGGICLMKKKKPKYNFSNFMYDFDHSEAPYIYFKEF